MPDNDEERRKAIAAAYSRDYLAKNREARAVYMREWEAKNREARNAYQRARLAEDPERRKANQARTEAWVKENRDARLEHQRRYREKNRDKLREADKQYIRDETGALTDTYKKRLKGKTAQWRQGLEAMAGRPKPEFCEVCGSPPDKGKSLHFDHCHQGGHFRGWLCRGCNLILGYAKDDRNRLLKLIAYLDRTQDGVVGQSNLLGV